MAQTSGCDRMSITDQKSVPRILFSGSSATGSVQRGNFLADYRILGRFVDIDLRPMLILLGHVVIGEDRFNRTFGHTGIAIDARVGIDIKAIG